MPRGKSYHGGKPVTKPSKTVEPEIKSGSLSRLKQLTQQRDKMNEELLKEQSESICDLVRAQVKHATTPEEISKLNERFMRAIAILMESS